MGETTRISWCDATFNLWWGCQKVSDGCRFCYAERDSQRYFPGLWGPPSTSQRKMMSDKYWRQLHLWNEKALKAGIRRRVFCSSMADVFEDNPDPEVKRARFSLWGLIEDTPALDWLLLTKRPENIETMLPERWLPGKGIPRNVWFGTSCEDQDNFDARWPVLESFAYIWKPAITFLSLEPLLGPIDLSGWLEEIDLGDEDASRWAVVPDWVIVGGESGPMHRQMDLNWARSLRDQCAIAGVPFFYKQASGLRPGENPTLDGKTYHEFPVSPIAGSLIQNRLF